MAKLYYRYGAMNSGKSTAVLQVAFNYEERGQRVVIAKPAVDTKADRCVSSRLGLDRQVDFLIAPHDDPRAQVHEVGDDIACVIVDEAQFLAREQVDQLLRLAVLDNIPVLAYGIRTDFRTEAFTGSRRLLELAHSIEELKTICRCGRKAVFNARIAGGHFIFDGAQVAIDGVEVTYEALCGRCYLEAAGDRLGSS